VDGNIQIRRLSEQVLHRLSALAASHNRTIAEEALAILEDALSEPSGSAPREAIDQAQRKKNEARRRAMIDWALR
jgi:plasmid stability protein